MKKERFNTLKKASLASTLGIFVFTYAGSSEANDDVVEEELIESTIEEPEEAEVIEDITEETQEEQIIDSEHPIQTAEPTENTIEETTLIEPESADETRPAKEIYEVAEPAVEETIETEYEELISEDMKVSEKSIPQISIFAANDSSDIDIESPDLVSVETDKQTYQAGEQVELRVISEDKTNVDYIYARLTNNTEYGPETIGNYDYTTTKLSNNRYESLVYIDIPERTPDTTYRLSTLNLYDGDYSTSLSDWYGEELLNLSIEIKGNKNIDIEPPQLISVETDKQTYQAGEQVELRVISKDKTNVDYIYARLTNNTEYGPETIGNYDYTTTKLSNNRYESLVYIDIPERTPDTTYRLSTLNLYDGDYSTSLSDWYGEELLNLTINIGEGATVVTPPEDNTDGEQIDSEIPQESIIDDDLSQNVINHVSILDYETGQILTNISFVGTSFDDRLNHVLQKINEAYGTEYNIVDQSLINSETSGVQINDYANYFTTDTYEVYVSNNSMMNYPFENRPFLPEHNIYDNHYENPYGLMQINIIDSYGNYLYSGETFGSYTVDGLIREVMAYVAPEEYYYESVYVSNGIMIRTDYYGEYQGIDVYVGNRADKTNEVPMPEEPSVEVPEEGITEQPDTGKPADDSAVEQPDTEEPAVDSPSEEPDIGELVEELIPEQPDNDVSVEGSTPEQTDTDNEDTVTETSGTENNGTDSVTLPSVNPVLPGADVISGVAVPESTGTITLPDSTEVTAESDLEGNWTAEIPADSQIVAEEILTVVFNDEKTGTQPELDVTVISNDTTHEEAAEEELLPETGEAKANTGIIAAAAAFLGGVLLFVTGRRKASKK